MTKIHEFENSPLEKNENEITEEKQNPAFIHLSRGGLRGLQVLSVAECRNLSDVGMAKLKELKYIKKLNLLWCTKIEDEGLKSIAK